MPTARDGGSRWLTFSHEKLLWRFYHVVGDQAPATLDDLYGVEGKAELIGGRIVHFMSSGDLPTEVAFEIAVSLARLYAEDRRGGRVSRRDRLRPAPAVVQRSAILPAGCLVLRRPAPFRIRMRFIDGAPTLAVEVRSEQDYGDAAEAEQAAKRADYFEAGTLVVWDIDPLARTITVYRSAAPTQPVVYGPGHIAEAEPAAPGWRLAVADLFS